MEHNNELYIPVPVDIDAVKSKFLFGLTLRQIICFGIGIGLGLAVYFACKGLLGDSIAGILMMFIMLPAFFFAVYEQHGEPLEVIIRRIWRVQKRPQHRPYQTINTGGITDGCNRTARKDHRKNPEKTANSTFRTGNTSA